MGKTLTEKLIAAHLVSGSMEPLRDRVVDYVPRGYVGRWNIAELLRQVRERIEEERETDGSQGYSAEDGTAGTDG